MSVYFAQRRQGGLIKIGWSRSVSARMRSLKTKLLGAIPGDKGNEVGVHNQFAHLWVRGEWFRPTDELLRYIRDHAQRHTPDSEMVATAFRLPRALLDRASALARRISQPGLRIVRAKVMTAALRRGLDVLESEYKEGDKA